MTGPADPATRWAHLELAPDGTITAVDDAFAAWTGRSGDDLIGTTPFSALLTAGGRIYHETHFLPLLLMQGEVREVAFDIVRTDGTSLAVLVHATLARDTIGAPVRIDVALVDATVRRTYERELQRARRAAEAAEREVRSIAEALQRSLLQRADLATEVVAVATRYRPAVDALEVGGDWHDAFPVDDRTIGVSVGDVVGKGIDAACAMGQLRSALRALGRTGAGPSTVLGQIDGFVRTVPGALAATTIYAEVDLATLRLTYSAAGHPPPIRVPADGPAEVLWGGRSTPVGAPPPGRSRAEGAVVLGPGDRVLLYTDGLCERHDRTPDAGFALVAQHAERLRHLPLDDAADELMATHLTYEDVRDDTCLLLLEVLG